MTWFASQMKHPEHITLLEGRGIVQAMRHKARSLKFFHCRHLHLNDNLGMVLSFDRGRAKDKALLFQCRRSAALSVAMDCEFHFRWIPSELNVADSPSRKFEPRRNGSKRQAIKFGQELLYPGLEKERFESKVSHQSVKTEREALCGSCKGPSSSRFEKKDLRHHRRRSQSKETKAHNARPRVATQTFLEQSAVSPKTAADYKMRMDVFNMFCFLHKLTTLNLQTLNTALTIFLQQCFNDGMELNEATKFLAAIMDARPEASARHLLPRARRSLKGWKNLDPGRSRPPIPR